jgi:hypothetical protein
MCSSKGMHSKQMNEFVKWRFETRFQVRSNSLPLNPANNTSMYMARGRTTYVREE